MGSAIRAALRADADGSAAGGDQVGGGGPRERVRPHVRRAHWHGYWTGPAAARRLDMRWLPPIAVALRDQDRDSLPAVIRPV